MGDLDRLKRLQDLELRHEELLAELDRLQRDVEQAVTLARAASGGPIAPQVISSLVGPLRCPTAGRGVPTC
jgi:hypothetical protein